MMSQPAKSGVLGFENAPLTLQLPQWVLSRSEDPLSDRL